MAEKKIKDLSFEEALAELQQIVGKVESGKGNLEDIVKDYERGNELKLHCENKLQEARFRIDKINQSKVEPNEIILNTEGFDDREEKKGSKGSLS